METNRDRDAICAIISQMLDNPDNNGIYPTSTAFTQLEHYIRRVRMHALGWMHAYCCICLDKDRDPRTEEIPVILEQERRDNGRQ